MDANIFDQGCITKMQEIFRRQHQNSDGGPDCPDLDFVYSDCDTFQNELAEIYAYSEQPEFHLNQKAFEEIMEQFKLPPVWQKLTEPQKHSLILKLLDQLEVNNRDLRMTAARCILYIVEGCWLEVQSDFEQQEWARKNVFLLYRLGMFSAFTDLLNIEIEMSHSDADINKAGICLTDSKDLRVILTVLCTMTEVIRHEKNSPEQTEYKEEVESFIAEISYANKEDLLALKLLNMVTKFCGGWAPHFPMKKVLLLLWKIVLLSLGGTESLKEQKNQKRMQTGLPVFDEDTIQVAKTMRPSSPPANATDLLETQNQKPTSRAFRRGLIKQSSLNDDDSLRMELNDIAEETELSFGNREFEDKNILSTLPSKPSFNEPMDLETQKSLPWKPKVRQKDIDTFLEIARLKFIGYNLQGDRESLAGLPQPIHEGVRILKEHLYTSLAELQIQREEEVTRNPLSAKEEPVEVTPAEILYQAMLPHLPQYMIALLKILLAAAPTSKAKTESINVMGDVIPEEMPKTVVQSMKLSIDVNRHKEIIVKAISGTILLLLKHFKLNHIYQFEFMAQHLVFANCVPLILKFFNQNIMLYVGATNSIPILEFPSCVIGEQPELTAETLEIGCDVTYSWRNLFACINLLRILNKLIKWKHSRIMMLVMFKSAPILKRVLKIRLGLAQLYVLKLLKMQAKYLGRQWRKSNMKTISAIYSKVRHRFNDDWVFGNELETKPWDFQSEECSLRIPIDRFNARRYAEGGRDSDFEPVDNCLNSVLGQSHDLPEGFKKHYGLWLNEQVLGESIEWDKLLNCKYM